MFTSSNSSSSFKNLVSPSQSSESSSSPEARVVRMLGIKAGSCSERGRLVCIFYLFSSMDRWTT